MQADALVAAVGLTGVLVVVLIDFASFVLAVLTARRLLVDADVSYRPRLLRFTFDQFSKEGIASTRTNGGRVKVGQQKLARPQAPFAPPVAESRSRPGGRE